MWVLFVVIAAVCIGFFRIIPRYVVRGDVKSYVFSFIFDIVCSLFFLFFIPGFKILNGNGWLIVVLAGLLYAINNYVGYEVYKHLDVSIISPLMNTVPAVVLLLSVLFLGEEFTFMKLFGVLLIIAGAFIITFEGKKKYNVSRKGLLLALASIVVSGTAMVFDKVGVSFFSVELYGFMAFFLPGLFISPFALRRGNFSFKRSGWLFMLLASVLLFVGYMLVLVSYTLTTASNVVSVLQLSVIVSMIGGFVLHKEGHVARKLAGAIVIISGVLLIVF